MSVGGSGSSNQSQQTSQSYLDPQVMGLLTGNYGQAQNTVANSQYTPLSGSLIDQYMNPYQQDVVNSTMGALNEQNQEQISQNGLSQAASGAYNSDRAGVQNAETNRLYSQTAAQTLAQLENQNYSQATSTAQTENQNINNWPLLLQQLLNQSAGLLGNPVLNTAQGTSSGSSSAFSLGLPKGS